MQYQSLVICDVILAFSTLSLKWNDWVYVNQVYIAWFCNFITLPYYVCIFHFSCELLMVVQPQQPTPHPPKGRCFSFTWKDKWVSRGFLTLFQLFSVGFFFHAHFLSWFFAFAMPKLFFRGHSLRVFWNLSRAFFFMFHSL